MTIKKTPKTEDARFMKRSKDKIKVRNSKLTNPADERMKRKLGLMK